MGYISIIRQIWVYMRFVRPYIKVQYYIILITLITSLLELASPLVNKFLIDEFFINRNFSVLYVVVALQVLLVAFAQIFSSSRNYLISYLGNQLSFRLRKNIFKKALGSKEDNRSFDVGDIYVVFERDVFCIEQTLINSILEMMLVIFNLIIMSSIMLSISWKFYLALFITLPISLINNNMWFGKLMKRNQAEKESFGEMFNFVNEALNNTKYLKLTAKQKYTERKFVNRNKETIRKVFAHFRITLITSSINGVVSIIDTIASLLVGGGLVYSGDLSIGGYLALVSYKSIFSVKLYKLVNFKIDTHQIMNAMSRINSIMSTPQEYSGGEKVYKVEGDICMKDIDFRYPDGKKVLDSFNLHIKSKEKIAIVGESGSGKTTLVNLILGLYRVDAGEILIDGKKLYDLDIMSFRRRVGIVTQDSFFYHDTVRENLTFGRQASDEEVQKVCEICQISEYIKNDSKGLDKVIDARGRNVSGGQKQRLSLARALLREADLIILDEATSAVDNITEANLFAGIKNHLENKTVISIAHRLSTIMDSDRIVVLKDGSIIEQGKHNELMEMQGYYYSLVKRKSFMQNTT
ncbi:MAG: ABC transporter ATP-binding protein/permease [Clostridia bacterium]|nr:ABC transporter ATP-binding protein/permease [Clostridia bacterium]